MDSQLIDQIQGYLSWSNIKLFGGGLLAVWFVYALGGRLGVFSRLWDLGHRFLGPQLAQARLKLEAEKASKAGDWLTAGLQYDQLGDWEKALDCYEQAKEFHLAGEVCLRLGHREVAAEWFLESEEKLRAARIFEELGEHRKAAEAFIKAGSSLDAAGQYFKAGEFEKAGAIYEKVGNHLRAGAAFEKAGDFSRAGENFERELAEVGAGGRSYHASGTEAELTRLCLRAARAFESAGELERALLVLDAGGQPAPAAQLAERLGQHRRAAELYRRAGALTKAAELLEMAGDHQAAANLLGDEQLSSGDALAAAESFLKGGDLLRAAEVFEGIGRFDRASECYEKGEAYLPAAEAALRAEDRSRAAPLFEKAGAPEKAAELYSESGDAIRASKLFAECGRYFDAAKAAAEANSEKEMVSYLQQVPPNDENYGVAVVQLARAFSRRGWSALALEKLTGVLRNQEVTPGNLDLWDGLAQAEEAEGNYQKAADILYRMMAVQYNFPGIGERRERLLRRLDEEQLRAETIKSKEPRAVAPRAEEGPRYEVKGMLGRGGMGAVYRAYDKLLKRAVAYKVLSEALSDDRDAREQFLQEARSAAAMNHPNIVTVYDLGFDGERAFICMELVEGESYQSLLAKQAPLTISQSLHFLLSVCQGLDHAHQRGIVHRDMKPSNVLLTTDNRVKVLDFGLAQPHQQENGAMQSSPYAMSGTPKYICPEAIKGEGADARSDIYSVGATLYELLMGHAPFTQGNLLMHHLHTPPPPLRKKRPDIPEKLEELVLLCLAKTPMERFQSTGEILAFASAAGIL